MKLEMFSTKPKKASFFKIFFIISRSLIVHERIQMLYEVFHELQMGIKPTSPTGQPFFKAICYGKEVSGGPLIIWSWHHLSISRKVVASAKNRHDLELASGPVAHVQQKKHAASAGSGAVWGNAAHHIFLASRGLSALSTKSSLGWEILLYSSRLQLSF